ncbi:MAG TPA: HNH endonuclease [Treponema sp.]|nr:HNH endonuclease [Treponema sp.]
MKYWLGVTDTEWFSFLSTKMPEDINFWQPSGNPNQFRAIEQGAPFLFKLKSPLNAIGGVGFFSTQTFQPVSIAWDAFGERNGCATYTELKKKIDTYRYRNKKEPEPNPVIGCIILTNPIFFKKEDWIPTPENWGASIVQGKTYDTNDVIGNRLWAQVEERLEKYRFYEQESITTGQFLSDESFADMPRYRDSILSRVRVGQGAFRMLITDAYHKSCSITGDHTLPVLEAAHIKPFAADGPHAISNGLLLRSDLHKLYDSGYLTITPDYHVEVSSSLKEEFNNGKIYYAMHGQHLCVVPDFQQHRPNTEHLIWHNENVFRVG